MQLRDYQIKNSAEGLAILKRYGLVYLACQARTGKTATALNIAKEYGAKKVLFITKKKAIGSIKKDFEALKPGYDLYVINYESVHTITEKFDFVIIDECHSLGQFPRPSQGVQLIKKLCEGLPIVYLSGTPSPESFSQLFHQFYVSSCSPFKEYVNFYKWANDGFVKIKKKMINGIPFNDYKAANKEKIDQFTKHLFITFSQKDAGFMQEVQEEILTVKMKSQTYWLANKLLRDRVHIGKQGEEIIADTGVKLQNKLHQIFSGSVIDEKGTPIGFDDTKARFIAEKFAGKKIAIFYIFRAELEMLRWVFKGRITDSPEEFNNSSDLVFCSQIQSGSMGTNLSTAEALIFYNIHFSNLQYWQARERMQLQKRETPALLYWVFSEGGLESKIYDAVAQKKDYVISYFRKDFLVTELKNIA
jgi:hypothetical protein